MNSYSLRLVLLTGILGAAYGPLIAIAADDRHLFGAPPWSRNPVTERTSLTGRILRITHGIRMFNNIMISLHNI